MMRIRPCVRSNCCCMRVLFCLFCCALFSLASARNAKAQSPPQQQPAARIPQIDSATRAEVAEKFAQALADDYAHADKGTAIAAAIRAKLNAKHYDAVTSPSDFAPLSGHHRAACHSILEAALEHWPNRFRSAHGVRSHLPVSTVRRSNKKVVK